MPGGRSAKGRRRAPLPVPRLVVVAVVTEPVEGPVKVGIKVEEDPTPDASGAAAGFDRPGLAQCESGGDPTAVDSAGGYHGLYQFSVTTWESIGGSGLPSEASPGEQTSRARALYETVDGNWRSQWPQCGTHLFD